MQDPGHPIDDMRYHAALELLGEQRAHLRPRRFRVELRKNDGVEARVPKPLVRVVFFRGYGVLIPSGYPPILFQESSCFQQNVHRSSIAKSRGVIDNSCLLRHQISVDGANAAFSLVLSNVTQYWHGTRLLQHIVSSVIPFVFIIKFPPPRYERIILNRNEKGRILRSIPKD